MPPYKRFFVEWEQPLIPGAKRMGSLFIACKPDEAEDIARAVIGKGARATPAKIVEFRQNVRCRWIYITLDFLEFPFKDDGDHIWGSAGPTTSARSRSLKTARCSTSG